MDSNDRDGFVARLTVVSEMYSKKLSGALLVLYFDALRDIPAPAVFAALEAACKVCEWFPKPADIRKLAFGDSEDKTEAAWVLLRQAMRQVGSYSSLVVDDAALAETVTSMWRTWPMACREELTPEMWSAKRKEFGRVYRVLRQRGLSGSRYLAGMCEQQNAGRLDWMKFAPCARLSGHAARELSTEEAEHVRGEIAATSHALSRLDAESILKELES